MGDPTWWTSLGDPTWCVARERGNVTQVDVGPVTTIRLSVVVKPGGKPARVIT